LGDGVTDRVTATRPHSVTFPTSLSAVFFHFCMSHIILGMMGELEERLAEELEARRRQTRWVRDLVIRGEAMRLFP
jgi:hypothetical protein